MFELRNQDDLSAVVSSVASLFTKWMFGGSEEELSDVWGDEGLGGGECRIWGMSPSEANAAVEKVSADFSARCCAAVVREGWERPELRLSADLSTRSLPSIKAL